MQLVVPMAGLGQRFADAGYALPKPLIPVDGLSMVVRAVNDLPVADRQVFVVHPDHVRQHGVDQVLRKHFPNGRIIVAPDLTRGQACTVRLAGAELDANEPVLVAACDNSHLYDAADFAHLTADPAVDCLIWTYRRDSRVLHKPTAHGWVKTRPDSVDVELVSCKQPISDTLLDDHAVTGCFWFRSAGQMLSAIDALVASGETVNNEFYLDVVPNVLIRGGRRVAVFEVDKFIGWGTPHDLEEYNRLQRYIAARQRGMVRSPGNSQAA
jgi:NDP-sugar pyrophosphorylase family protein